MSRENKAIAEKISESDNEFIDRDEFLKIFPNPKEFISHFSTIG